MDSAEGLKTVGAPSLEELKAHGCLPEKEEYLQGPFIVMECIEGIPCNPCEAACPKKAITVGDPITNLPRVDRKLCVACGICISACPGLAIYRKDYCYSDTEATVSFPFEYLPLPEIGQSVKLVNRCGEEMCDGVVSKVVNPPANRATAVITAVFDKKYFEDVVNMKRL